MKARLTLKVRAGARRTEFGGPYGSAWKLHVSAPPVDGKANEACVRFFADLADVPQSRVRIVLGLSNRTKVVEIDGASEEMLESRLIPLLNR